MILTVYRIICNRNNKIYIGITSNLRSRWNKHVYDAKHNSKCVIHRAIRKYGIDNFSLDIIKICKDKKDLLESEVFFIDYFNSHVSKGGYNETWGGEAPMLGRKHTILSKKLISNKLKGRKSPNKGKTASLYTKKLMGAKHSIKVSQLDLSGNIIALFNSITAASLATNIANSNISGVCRNIKKIAGGYCWKYYLEEKNA